ncbi:MAG: transcription termination/antitermination NusG family protein [Chloroflexota bacterium]
MSAYWYSLHTKPHRERSVYKLLLSHELIPTLSALSDKEQPFEVFFPSMRVKPVNPRSAKIRPFFPGYLFVYVDLEAVGNNAFSWIPGTHGLVSFGGEPAIVPENLVDALKNAWMLWPYPVD